MLNAFIIYTTDCCSSCAGNLTTEEIAFLCLCSAKDSEGNTIGSTLMLG
jgi:hypothetical protein